MKRQKKKNKRYIIVIILLLYISTFTIVYGRYTLKKVNSKLAESKEFYFNSDILSEEEPQYNIIWDGTESYQISVSLFSKDNDLNSATYDIPYKLSYKCSSNAQCILNKETGKVSAKTNEDTFTVTVIPNSLLEPDNPVEITIYATTINGFEKTISAKYVLYKKADQVYYNIEDERNRNYLIFNFSNMKYKTKEITLNFDSNNILLDTTSSMMNSINSYTTNENDGKINSIAFNVGSMTTVNLRFFKVDKTMDYTNDESIIEVIIKNENGEV